MELSELDEQAKLDLPVANDDYDDEEEQMRADVIDGMGLLGSVKTLLDYLSDPLLCKTVTKRERDIMDKLSEKIREYLCEVEPTYSEDD
jgi:hypothetical protein